MPDASVVKARFRLGLAGLFTLALAIPLILLFATTSLPEDGPAYLFGRLAGLVGLAACLLQPVGMTAAGAWCFGAKKMNVHKFCGIGGISLLLLHPLGLAIGEGDVWMFALDAAWPVQLGKLALVLMVVAAGAFFLIRVKLLKFALFTKIHLLAFPAALIGLVHAYYAGTSFHSSPLLLGYYLLLAAAATACFTGLRIKRYRSARPVTGRAGGQ